MCVRVYARARLECMEVRKACRFVHEISCRVRRRERILEEHLFVFRLAFFIIEGKKRAKSTIKKKCTCLALISRICARRGEEVSRIRVRRGEEGAPRLSHRVCNVYVPGNGKETGGVWGCL